MTTTERTELAELRRENARLRAAIGCVAGARAAAVASESTPPGALGPFDL
ncbi:MAG TPA: hypothetical protein VK988_05400 [Acidimicrobiales bacterium]|nr:hypothetical protein [Acidimicrobiales bacterium]